LTSSPKILAIDRYISNLVNSTSIDSRVGTLATEIDHKSNNHLSCRWQVSQCTRCSLPILRSNIVRSQPTRVKSCWVG